MKRRIAAFWLMISLLLFAAQAGADAPIVVNPESAPGTAAETAAMADAVVKEAMESQEITSRFADEVTAAAETVPCESYADMPLTGIPCLIPKQITVRT